MLASVPDADTPPVRLSLHDFSSGGRRRFNSCYSLVLTPQWFAE